MRLVTDQKWLARMKAALSRGEQISEVLRHSCSQQSLIALLACTETPFRVLNFGCGVRRITTKTDVCPKCKGTGKC